MKLLWRILGRALPPAMLASLRNYRTLSVGHGQYVSMRRRESIDAARNPIPWYTYPALAYLDQIDFSRSVVFEYGSGNSTLYWARRCKRIVSVEHDPAWHATVHGQCPANVEHRLIPDATAYAAAIREYEHEFDVVIIDGIARYECARMAVDKLAGSGILILDNADRESDTAAFLRSTDLLEVDMTGFGPINNYPWTTSLFFGRSARPRPRHDRQPVHGIGTDPAY